MLTLEIVEVGSWAFIGSYGVGRCGVEPRVSVMARRAGATPPRAAAGRGRAMAAVGAAAVLDAIAVGQFIAEAAFQAAALPRELRGVQAELLLLGHLDRDRLERRQERRAAERPSARTVAAEHLGLVAHADLAHLDADVEVAGEVAHQLAEIDARLRGVIEDQPRAVERVLDARQLHRQSALADFQLRDALRLLLALLLLQALDDVLLRGAPHHDVPRLVGGAAAFGQR